MTYMVRTILQEQGYDVELLNADLAPIFTSLSRKKADVFMDVWLPVTMNDYIAQMEINWKLSGRYMMRPASGW